MASICWSCAALCAACGDQRGADFHLAAGAVGAQAVQGFEQGQEGPRRQRVQGAAFLVVLEGGEALFLEHALGLVGEQHGVAVEGDAHFLRVLLGFGQR